MAADGERFDERKLLEREGRRGMELASRHDKLRPHAAVDVNSQNLQPLAAIWPAAAAGIAGRVIEVRLDGAAIARLDVGNAVADHDDLDAELVAQNTWIG